MPATAAAIARLHGGDRDGARADLLALWETLETDGAPLHLCTLAHFLADTEKDVAAELLWDRRALLAATGADDGADRDPVDPALATFLPSLHLNAGDACRRLGEIAPARRDAEAGLARTASLPDDGYGATIKAGLRRLHDRLDRAQLDCTTGINVRPGRIRLKSLARPPIFETSGRWAGKWSLFAMANWSDPQPNASSFQTVDARAGAYDAGLRRYMLSVYNYMASGVLLTGIVAMLFSAGGMQSPAAQIMLGGGLLKYVIMFAPLGFILAMNFGLQRMSNGALQAVFWGFAVTMGLSLSTIFLVYTGPSIAQAFFASAAAFAGLSLFGYTTKRSLSAMGTFMIMGLIGLIVASLLNLWFQSSAFALVISLVGVVIFAGLTAYDTQRTKSLYAHVVGTGMEQKTVILSATNLYLDFVNMFLFLLRIFGSTRN